MRAAAAGVMALAFARRRVAVDRARTRALLGGDAQALRLKPLRAPTIMRSSTGRRGRAKQFSVRAGVSSRDRRDAASVRHAHTARRDGAPLRATGPGVLHIALEVDFESACHFSVQFKRGYRVTPLAYRLGG
ncbi:helix-turn-helix domain-containing protein [Paraburkholderia sp. MMS20-SJTR3]|uniref:Helix-turn-helix domain-containing protein n=1 Tax=Paraburkholderia sejongensis TaxID=2886946 RepID=A0ABS8JY73_9BURK|nr:helix-turn-helix domain-containing protein [Paraburkholderia sp. MMS20-SJTR3]MCC8394844.1 helix-turn-helix domain-containing protein [Paraburkholderia sp. MMS20-SJTR3]